MGKSNDQNFSQTRVCSNVTDFKNLMIEKFPSNNEKQWNEKGPTTKFSVLSRIWIHFDKNDVQWRCVFVFVCMYISDVGRSARYSGSVKDILRHIMVWNHLYSSVGLVGSDFPERNDSINKRNRHEAKHGVQQMASRRITLAIFKASCYIFNSSNLYTFFLIHPFHSVSEEKSYFIWWTSAFIRPLLLVCVVWPLTGMLLLLVTVNLGFGLNLVNSSQSSANTIIALNFLLERWKMGVNSQGKEKLISFRRWEYQRFCYNKPYNICLTIDVQA